MRFASLRRGTPWCAAVLLVLAVAACGPEEDAPGIIVGAAASLEPLLREMAESFEAETSTGVTLEFAASGVIASQIEQGAPIDVFVSADAVFVDRLLDAGALSAETVRAFGNGQVVVVTSLDAESRGWLEVATGDANRHVATANPELAPYGRAAREALQQAGAWNQIERKIAYAENVTQALQFVLQGSAETGFVSRAQVEAGLHEDLAWLPVDHCLHAPIAQTAAVVTGTSQASRAKAFIDFIVSKRNVALVERYGYTPATASAKECGRP